MTIVNSGNFCQVSLPSGESCIRTICHILRQFGWQVKTWSMGMQVTRMGTIKLTMIDVRPGKNPDTLGGEGHLPTVNTIISNHAAYIGDF